ncbi:MAG: excalibur calcium-binding domain-containing protein [Betaproteobacteria bacterium]|nr:excalibur calcium-binding domain-containing protein [Betaproteobacteria bacterium]
MKNFILLALVVAAGWYGYGQFQKRSQLPAGLMDKAALRATSRIQFNCDGRIYCSQMSSCAEATYFLQHCPGTKMDGDNDGVPCERQWCN